MGEIKLSLNLEIHEHRFGGSWTLPEHLPEFHPELVVGEWLHAFASYVDLLADADEGLSADPVAAKVAAELSDDERERLRAVAGAVKRYG